MTTSTFPRSSSNTAVVSVAWTRRCDGDFHPTRVRADELSDRQRRLIDRPWTMLDQCHGAEIVRIDEPGDMSGQRADGAITNSHTAALAVWVGDCAPLTLIGATEEFAVVHAGWRGLANGVIDAAVAAFDEPVELAVLGPVICGDCYEFGASDLDQVAARIGVEPSTISSVTSKGALGLDMTGAVGAALEAHAVPTVSVGPCPGCAPDGGFSHRMRSERERHVMVAWQA